MTGYRQGPTVRGGGFRWVGSTRSRSKEKVEEGHLGLNWSQNDLYTVIVHIHINLILLLLLLLLLGLKSMCFKLNIKLFLLLFLSDEEL